MKRSYIREILDVIDENTISFAGGLPNAELFPRDEIQKAAYTVLQDSKALQYSSSIGIESLRKKIANFYNDKLNFPTSEDEILITSGSQQAFDIILKGLNKNQVIVEEPSYIGALSSFQVLNKRVKSFKKISQLYKKLGGTNILYLISDFQNPSTFSYSNTQRDALRKIVNKSGTYLIEDGAYTFLDFDNEFKTPISKGCDKSLHLGSFSKIVAPGLRVGWIRANKELIDKLLVIKESLDLHTSTLSQMIIDEYLQNNDMFEHIKTLNKEYKSRMDFMGQCLDKYVPSFNYQRAKGGMFIYGSLDCDTMPLAKECLKKGLAIVPAEVFYLNKKSNEVRLNFTNSSFTEIEEGVKILASVLKKQKKIQKPIWKKLIPSLKQAS